MGRVGLAHGRGRRSLAVLVTWLGTAALVLSLVLTAPLGAVGTARAAGGKAKVTSTTAPAPTPTPAIPSPTGANGNPFGGVSPVSPVSTTSSTPTGTAAGSTTGGSGSLSGASLAAIVIGALVVLGGISFFIWYDARRRAPRRSRSQAGAMNAPGEGRRSGSKPPAKARKLSQAERRRRKRGRARR